MDAGAQVSELAQRPDPVPGQAKPRWHFPPGSCAYGLSSAGSSYAGGHQLAPYDFDSSIDCAPLPGWTPGGGSQVIVGGPVILTIRVVGGPPVDPRPFRLELLAMDLSGVAIPGDVCVRESPVLASLGQGQADDGLPGAT